MKRLSLTVLLAVIPLMPAGGCESFRACTEATCDSLVDFVLPAMDLDRSEVNIIDARACVNDICRYTRWRVKGPGHTAVRGYPGVEVNAFRDHTKVQLLLPLDPDLEVGQVYDAWVELTLNDSKVTRVDDEIPFQRVYPNGPGCDPVCLQGEVKASED